MKRTPSRKSARKVNPPRSRKAKTTAGKGSVHFHIKRPRYRPYPKKEYGRKAIPGNIKRIIKKARAYSTGKKSAYSKALRVKVEAELRSLGIYTDPEIKRILNLRKSGQVSKIALQDIFVTGKRYKKSRIRVKDSKTGKFVWRTKNRVSHYKVGGKWLTRKSFLAKIRMTRYWAVVNHYRSMYGLTLKEARKLFMALRGEYGDSVFEALY